MDYTANQNKQQPQNNILAWSFGVLLLIFCGFMVYVYLSFDLINKGDLKEKYVYKDDIDFYILPSYIQDRYIEKYIYTSKVDNLNSQIQDLKSKENQQCEQIVVEKEIIKYKHDFKEIDSYSCYSMIDGGLAVSKNCIKKLHSFLDMNKEAKMFRIIGVVDKTEFALITKIKYFEDDIQVNRLSKLAHLGLAQKRVIDASQIIKNHLGIHTNIQFEDYIITSKKNLTGFIIRAYDL